MVGLEEGAAVFEGAKDGEQDGANVGLKVGFALLGVAVVGDGV